MDKREIRRIMQGFVQPAAAGVAETAK